MVEQTLKVLNYMAGINKVLHGYITNGEIEMVEIHVGNLQRANSILLDIQNQVTISDQDMWEYIRDNT